MRKLIIFLSLSTKRQQTCYNNDILRILFLLLGVPLESQEDTNENETDAIDKEDSINDVPERSFPATKVTGETVDVRYDEGDKTEMVNEFFR